MSSFSDDVDKAALDALTIGFRIVAGALTAAGVNRKSVGTFAFDATGAITGHASGSAEAGKPHPLSSSGLGYGIEMQLDAVSDAFALYANGGLSFRFDTSVGVPPAGTYEIAFDPGDERQGAALRNPTALFVTHSASAWWHGLNGQVRIRSSTTGEGLEGDFTVTFVRDRGGPPDTMVVSGRFDTR
jgi:hypothetical protein